MSSQRPQIAVDDRWNEFGDYLSELGNVRLRIDLMQLSHRLKQCSFSKPSASSLSQVDKKFTCLRKYITEEVQSSLCSSSLEAYDTLTDLLQALASYHSILDSLIDTDSLPHTSLTTIIGYLSLATHVLYDIIGHVIKTSSTLCSDEIALKLRDIWKYVNEFLLKLTKLIEKMQMSTEGVDDSDTEEVYSLASILVDIGHSLADIETKTMIVVFKTALRFLPKESGNSTAEKCVKNFILKVCEAFHLKVSSKPDLQQNTGLCKVLGFLLKLLAKLCTFTSEEGNRCKIIAPVLDVIFRISVNLTDVMYNTTVTVESSPVMTQIVPGLKTLLQSLIEFKEFCTNTFTHDSTVSPDMRLLVVCSCLESVSSSSSIYNHWYSDTFIQNLTLLLTQCSNEMCNPARNSGSLCYQFVLSRLCAFMATVPCGELFKQVEKLLLSMLFSSAVHINLLATDCWHFVARYSPEELAFQHCCKLLTLSCDHRLSDRYLDLIENMLSRLVPLLTLLKQQQLICFPNACYSGVLIKDFLDESTHDTLEAYTSNNVEFHYKKLITSGVVLSMCDTLAHLRCLIRSVCRITCWDDRKLQYAEFCIRALLENVHNEALDGLLCLALRCLCSKSLSEIYYTLLSKTIQVKFKSSSDDNVDIQIYDAVFAGLSAATWPLSDMEQKLFLSVYKESILGADQQLKLMALDSMTTLMVNTRCPASVKAIIADDMKMKEQIASYYHTQAHRLVPPANFPGRIWKIQPRVDPLPPADQVTTNDSNDCENIEPLSKKQKLIPDSDNLSQVLEKFEAASNQLMNSYQSMSRKQKDRVREVLGNMLDSLTE